MRMPPESWCGNRSNAWSRPTRSGRPTHGALVRPEPREFKEARRSRRPNRGRSRGSWKQHATPSTREVGPLDANRSESVEEVRPASGGRWSCRAPGIGQGEEPPSSSSRDILQRPVPIGVSQLRRARQGRRPGRLGIGADHDPSIVSSERPVQAERGFWYNGSHPQRSGASTNDHQNDPVHRRPVPPSSHSPVRSKTPGPGPCMTRTDPSHRGDAGTPAAQPAPVPRGDGRPLRRQQPRRVPNGRRRRRWTVADGVAKVTKGDLRTARTSVIASFTGVASPGRFRDRDRTLAAAGSSSTTSTRSRF